jgi:hypothetical protein
LIQDQAAARNIDSKKCSVSIRLLSDRYSSSSFATQSGVKRTWRGLVSMSANDPKRTSRFADVDRSERDIGRERQQRGAEVWSIQYGKQRPYGPR